MVKEYLQILEKHSTKNEDHHLLTTFAEHVGWKPGTTSDYCGAKVDEINHILVILPKRGANGEIRT